MFYSFIHSLYAHVFIYFVVFFTGPFLPDASSCAVCHGTSTICLGGGGWVSGHRGPRERSPSPGFKPGGPLTRQPPQANVWPVSARDLAEAALASR